MSSTSQRQGLSKTQSLFKGITTLRSLKTRTLAVFTLVLLTAVMSVTALTAKADQLHGSPQAGLAASFLNLFSDYGFTASGQSGKLEFGQLPPGDAPEEASQTAPLIPGGPICNVPADYATITLAIADAGCTTINVAVGTYNESVVINRTLILNGANVGEAGEGRNPVPVPATESIINDLCGPVVIQANNVVVDGFTIQGAATGGACFQSGVWTSTANSGYQIRNNIIQNNIAGINLNSNGGFPSRVEHNLIQNNNLVGSGNGNAIEVTSGLINATIESNKFVGHVNASVLVATGVPATSSNLTLLNNELVGRVGSVGPADPNPGGENESFVLSNVNGATISGNLMDGGFAAGFGVIHLAGNNQDIAITGNLITDNRTGIGVFRTSFGVDLGPNSGVTINGNCIVGNNRFGGLDVETTAHTGTLNAENNWWGSASGPTIASNPGGTGDAIGDPDGIVDYSPFLTAAAPPCACAAPPADMVAWYPGEVNANDIIGNPPNNGTYNGIFSPGKVGNAFSLDGVDDRVQVPAGGTIDVQANPHPVSPGISVDAWINPTDISQAPIVEYGNTATAGLHFWVGVFQPGDLFVDLAGTTGPPRHFYTSGAPVSAGTLQHVAFTYDTVSNTAAIYYNGVSQALNVAALGAGGPLPTGFDFYIGHQPFSGNIQFFTGVIDEVEVFNRALSGAEVAVVSSAGTFGKCHTSTIQFDAPAHSTPEGSVPSTFNFTLTRIGANDTAASVDFATANGTATGGTAPCSAGEDFIHTTTPTVAFAPGERTQQVAVTICGDAIDEPDETFTGTISNPTGTGASLGTPTVDTVTIIDDDAGLVFTVSSPTAAEGSPLAFVITRTGTSATDSTVCFSTADGVGPNGAVAPGDYTAIGPPPVCVTFTAAGPNTQTVNVTTIQDLLVEGPETMTLVLSGIVNGTGDGNFGTGTITNNDNTVLFNPTVYNVTETDGSQTVTLTVERGAGSDPNSTFQVDVSTIPLPGTAVGGASCTAGVDYITAGTTLTFLPTVLSLPFNVTVCGDLVFEPSEFFTAQLTNENGGNVTIDPAGQFATVNITDNDPQAVVSSDSPTIQEPASGTANLVFTVTRSNATQGNAVVTYTLDDAGATGGANCTTAGVDYIDGSGTLTFIPGDNTETVTVVVCSDAIFEGNESLTLNLTAGANVATANDGTGTITQNPAVGAPTFAIGDVTQAEGDAGTSPFNFLITRTGATSLPATITYHTEDGGAGGTPATAPSDYTAIPTFTVLFPAGVSTVTVPVIVNGDVIFEDTENFSVVLDNTTLGTISDNRGIGFIVNDDLAPVASISDCKVLEGASGTVPCVFTITLAGPTQLTSIVTYTTVDVTAVAPGDYTATAGTVTFAPGDPPKTVTVLVNGDTIFEAQETFILRMTNVTNGTFGSAPDVDGIGTINNDDGAAIFSVTGCTVTEGNAGTVPCVFNINRTFPAGTTGTQDGASVTFNTSNVTATAPSDYTAVTGLVVVFAAGESTKPVTVNVNGDTVNEPTETFTGTISAPTNSSTIGTASATGTITNDDLPSFRISDVTQNEGNAGQTAFVFTVTRDGSTALPSTVEYASFDGTAIAPGDYTEILPGTLAFGAGVSSLTITVFVNGDLTIEPDENFTVVLSNPVNATISDGTGVGTIVNDDGQPISISGTITNFSPAGPLAGVTVTLSGSVNAVTTTNAAGFYQFLNLPSGGNFLITPSLAGKTFSPITRSYNNLTASVANANFVAFDNGAIARNVRIVNGAAVAGSPTSPGIGVNLTSPFGDEASLTGSLAYDAALMNTPAITCGTAAPDCDLVNGFNTSVNGQIGFSIDAPAGGVFPVGDNNLFNVSFNTVVTGASSTPVTFTDVPSIRRTSDSSGNPLPTSYTNGFVVFTGQGLEGDVAPRTAGDGSVIANDVVQTRRFAAGLDTPDPSTNEKQRGDTSPASTRGDGFIDATDVVQTRRYAAGLDPLQPAGGPNAANPAFEDLLAKSAAMAPSAIPRVLRIQSVTGLVGQTVNVIIEYEADGGEDGASGTVHTASPANITISSVSSPADNPNIALGTEAAAAGFALTENGQFANQGDIGFLIDCLCAGLASSPPTNRIIVLTYTIAPGTAPGFYPLTWLTNPVPAGRTPLSVSDQGVNVTSQVVLENGGITVLPVTAAEVSVSGRVTSPNGQGLRNATVFLTDSDGNRRTVVTSSFGFYTFEGVEVGESYVVGVTARRYRFASRVVNVTDSLSDVDFVASE